MNGALWLLPLFAAVSYTHLDVYKRQVHDRPCFVVNERHSHDAAVFVASYVEIHPGSPQAFAQFFLLSLIHIWSNFNNSLEVCSRLSNGGKTSGE